MKRLRRWAFVLCMPLVPWLQGQIDARAHPPVSEPAARLWSGTQVRRVVPGFENIAADVYWLRAVQHYGSQRLAGRGAYPLLQPLLEITTALDPRFDIAYRYGSIFLAEPPPVGPGRPEEAVALLERGMKALPGSWLIPQLLGFMHFEYRGDARAAAEVLTSAARRPGAPVWLEALAADLLHQGGEREIAWRIWSELHRQAQDQFMRDNARLHLDALAAEDRIAVISAGVARFVEARGQPPTSLIELQAVGLDDGPLEDPRGTPFAYDPETGGVQISEASALWPIVRRRTERTGG